jgi:hypothetical protein
MGKAALLKNRLIREGMPAAGRTGRSSVAGEN